MSEVQHRSVDQELMELALTREPYTPDRGQGFRLARRLKVLKAKSPDPNEPRIALLPAWLIAELEQQGVRLDVSGYPEKVGMEPAAPQRSGNSACRA